MSAEFWKNTAPNITLDFWDKTNDDNEVTLVFQKGVEELLQNSIVARASVQHDRKAKERKKPIKPSDVAKTKDHLRNVGALPRLRLQTHSVSLQKGWWRRTRRRSLQW
eukprot:TRINITY_DN6926_c0_g1_i1.p1 TRINITY_DN6926_c0_g1~~TRINITY_DN6926_c0_g1_i1.p1  ORF type:complete len:108 (-),score=9.44 TRINITY_DN6926_c0_g1_i1:406-729(-)